MLAGNCQKYIPGFCELLQKADVKGISHNNYCQNYLQHLLTHKNYYLKIYAAVLDEVLLASALPLNEISILDFGTGNGLLALFAKYCGCQKVYACDVNADFLDAAEKLSLQLDLSIQKFIKGGLNEVKEEINAANLSAVISTDVIEHIYDLSAFFNEMKNLNPAMVSVMTTASNPENKWKVKQLRKLQIRDELHGYSGNKIETESHASYFRLRKEILQKEFKNLSPENLDKLANASRGLIKEDILKAAVKFEQKGILPVPADRFNTCHPINGSFTERILSFKEYETLYKQAGFSLKIKSGFYNSFGSLQRKLINGLLNNLLKFLKFKISPFIMLVGYKK